MIWNINCLGALLIGALSVSGTAAADGSQLKKQKKLRANSRNLVVCGFDDHSPSDIYLATSVVVDGQINDWNLDVDFYRPMTNAGEQDSSLSRYAEVGKAYVKYSGDSTERLCVLALADPGYIFGDIGDGSDTWLKNYDIGQSALEHVGQANVYIDGEIRGWEGCYDKFPPGCYDLLEIHAQWAESGSEGDPSSTASTGKYALTYAISLNLGTTGAEPPTAPTGPTSPTGPRAPSPTLSPIASDESCSSDSECTRNVACQKDVCVNGSCQLQSDDAQNGQGCAYGSLPVGFSNECVKAEGQCNAGTCEVVQDVTMCSTANTGFCEKPTCVAGACSNVADSDKDGQVCSTDVTECTKDKTCSSGICTPNFKASGEPCIDFIKTVAKTDDCTEGKCDGSGSCLEANKPEDTSCTEFTISNGQTVECTRGGCTAGTCTWRANVGIDCETASFPRGICDKGSKCTDQGKCGAQYKPSDTVCRSSSGCCDAEEFCTGNTYDCPADLLEPAGTVCRSSCPSCVSDPEETCDGVRNTCPDNTVLQEAVPIVAGQHYDAGTVTLSANPVSETSYELCAVMTLTGGWALDANKSEPIKLEFSVEGSPFRIPGRYTYKYPSTDIVSLGGGSYKFCTTISIGDEVYFAIHFDVANGDQTETAWALSCQDECPTVSAFVGTKWRKGWGEYFTWKSCDINQCEKCSIADRPTETGRV